MKEKLAVLWAKVVENKQMVIKVGGAVAGALIGAVVTSMIQNREELSEIAQYPFREEMDDQIDTIVEE